MWNWIRQLIGRTIALLGLIVMAVTILFVGVFVLGSMIVDVGLNVAGYERDLWERWRARYRYVVGKDIET